MTARQIDTPQTRTRILRLIRKSLPGLSVEFIEGLDRGIGFRIVDPKGAPRTHIIRVYRSSRDLFTKA